MEFRMITNPIALTKIKIIGVGGAGGNAVNSLIDSQVFGVEFLAANTDVQDLGKSKAETRIQLGKKLTEGLGAGGDPEKGRKAAEESIDEIEEALQNTNMLFITAGMGGGTGTGAAPVIAHKAREMGILTLAVVTIPFKYEGENKREIASIGIQNIQNCVDTIIVVPNSKITEVYRNLLIKDALKKSDEIITNAVHSIADIINKPGDLNVDFADVKAAMKNMGYAMIGIGSATGKDRAETAANNAIANPLLADIDLSGSKALLVNVTAGNDFLMDEFETINEVITQKTGNAGLIKPGLITEDAFDGQVRVTIIATGLAPTTVVKELPESLTRVFAEKNNNFVQDFPIIHDRVTPENIEQELNEAKDRIRTGSKVTELNLHIKKDNAQNDVFRPGEPPAFIKKYFN